MTAFLSIDMATGTFRRYRRDLLGRVSQTHQAVMPEPEWRMILAGEADPNMAQLEDVRLGKYCVHEFALEHEKVIER